MSALEIDSVHLTFGERKILSDIYLKCETGDIVGLLGRNGAGKSSLLKILFGTLKAENQSVRLNGTYVDQLHRRSNTVNYLPQDHFLMGYLTLEDLIGIFKLDKQKIKEVVELQKSLNVKLRNLSSGYRRFIEIAVALFSPTQFTLLDEPFSQLSPKLVETIIPLILDQSKNKGIILCDHQYESVFDASNRFYLLHHQRIDEIYHLSDLELYGYLPIKSAATPDMG